MTPQFEKFIKTYLPRYMEDLGIDRLQAAGIAGNFAVESGNFQHLEEINPTVPGSRGGWGWAQWTGPRRREFEAFAKAKGYKLDDPEGFYQFSLFELLGSEKAALAALKRTRTLDTATTAFMKGYERPGIPHLAVRKARALEALRVLDAHTGWVAANGDSDPVSGRSNAQIATDPGPAAKTHPEDALPAFEVSAIQRRLIELGYHTAGLANGVWGEVTRAAILRLQEQARATGRQVKVDGHYSPETRALLADDANRAVPSSERANITTKELSKLGNPGVVSGQRIQWASVASVVSQAFAVLVLAFQIYGQGTETLPWAVQAVLNFLPPWAAMLAPFAMAIYTAMQAKGLIGASKAKVQEGIDNTGLPPSNPGANLPWPFNLMHKG